MESVNFKQSINISAAGGSCIMRLGDTDGDGRLELVTVKPDVVSDERYFSHRVACITVFSVSGELLWQLGDPNSDAPSSPCEVPVQIYDIDKDGKNEIILIIDDRLMIIDGKTGEVKKSTNLPSHHACDCITIADLEGTGYAQNIIIKNKFSQMWAYDINLNIIWTFRGNLGHCPVVYDINGDGRDEVIAGYNVLSSQGELLFKIDMPEHARSVAVCCLYKKEEPIILIAGPKMRAYSSDGALLWELDERAENFAIGNFRPNISANDILILDNLSLFDSHGEFLLQKNETVYFPLPVCNFDSTGEIYIAGHKQEDIVTTVYDGYMRAVYTLPTFGKLCSGDIIGCGRSQIIVYNDETADIYSESDIDLSEASRPYPRPQAKSAYNISMHNTYPLSADQPGYVVDDFASQNILKWAQTYANINLHNSFSKVSRAEFVLLLAALLNLKEEFSDNFSDAVKDSMYYDAVGTFRKLGILQSEDNMFLPDIPITVEYANAILEKLSIPLNFNFDAKYELAKQDMAKLILSLNSGT